MAGDDVSAAPSDSRPKASRESRSAGRLEECLALRTAAGDTQISGTQGGSVVHVIHRVFDVGGPVRHEPCAGTRQDDDLTAADVGDFQHLLNHRPEWSGSFVDADLSVEPALGLEGMPKHFHREPKVRAVPGIRLRRRQIRRDQGHRTTVAMRDGEMLDIPQERPLIVSREDPRGRLPPRPGGRLTLEDGHRIRQPKRLTSRDPDSVAHFIDDILDQHRTGPPRVAWLWGRRRVMDYAGASKSAGTKSRSSAHQRGLFRDARPPNASISVTCDASSE